MGQPNFI